MTAVVAGTASAGLAAAVLVWSVIGNWIAGNWIAGNWLAGGHAGRRTSRWPHSYRALWVQRQSSSLSDDKVRGAIAAWHQVFAGRRTDDGVTAGSGHRDATADMVQVLDAMARSVRGGSGVHQALRAVIPVAGVHTADLNAVVGQLDGGMTLVDALAAWRKRRATPAVALATAVLTFGVDTGGSLARAVDGAAATLRERVALHGEVRVLAAQARASALVVGAAPVGFTVVVAVTDPRVAGFLLSTPAGWVCLVVGAGLEFGCVVWMRSLVARAGVL